MKILIIEDDKEVAENLSKGLCENGFATDVSNDGIDGLSAARQGHYAALIVDRMLPGLDGLSIVRQLRADKNEIPTLMLTALGEVDSKVEGFDAGVDDYLAKPFAFAELLARLRALVRRNVANNNSMQLTIGDLVMDKITREVTREGLILRLKPREFELLLYFSEHLNEPVTREMLLKDVWGLDFDPQTNLVDVHISRLRQKVDKGFRDPLIRTIRGVGYVFGVE